MADRAQGTLRLALRRIADRLNRLDVLSRIALIGLTSVLIVSTLFDVQSARLTRSAASAARTAHALDDQFAAAHYAVGAEESLERKYRLEPGNDVFSLHRASAASVTAAMLAVSDMGDAKDRSVARAILKAHRAYLSATKKMFAAVDERDTARVVALDHTLVDPVFGDIERAVAERAQMHRSTANRTLEDLDREQQRLISTAIVLSLMGLVSLGMFLFVLLAYQRRLSESHGAELARLEEAALVDHLTQIGNHRAYQEEFDREVSRAQRYDEMLSLVVIDIDDFKVTNDLNGHMYGDQVLKALAALLRTLRTEDRSYRLGGDEFAVLLPHTSETEAMETMLRMSAMVREQAFATTVSIGIATLKGVDCDREMLQAQADAAMYSGKRAGRNSVTRFDACMGDMWLLSPKKIHNLRELIADDRIEVDFQPIWDIEAGHAIAYEALSRPDAKYGFGGPQEAFDLAERIGRAHELDAVCRNAALRVAGSRLPHDALLFINVSPQSLDHDRLDPEKLLDAVRAAALSPERIVIEITERSITRVDAVVEAARALQEHGFRLALDDTGAGNSGLEILSRLTFDFVKIDREVIVKALHDRNARGVLAGIVAIAESSSAYVIAEGIENAELLHFVCHLGETIALRRPIHGLQGYLIRRPSRTFPDSEESRNIAALLKEYAVEPARVSQA